VKRILETDKRIIQCGLRAALRYDDSSDESEEEQEEVNQPLDDIDFIQQEMPEEIQHVLHSEDEYDPLDFFDDASSSQSEGIYDNPSGDDAEQEEGEQLIAGEGVAGGEVALIDKYSIQ